MYRTQCVLALLPLYVGLAHCFTWDIVLGRADRLEFYHDGILTFWAVPVEAYIGGIVYDPVHNRVLLTDSYGDKNIYSFDIATRKTQFLMKPSHSTPSVAYDPVTELYFWTDTYNIYSFSLKSGFKPEDKQNIVIDLVRERLYTIAVDSCGGYIYWTTYSDSRAMERVRFDGSGRELLIVSNNTNVTRPGGLVIDQQTQKIYWIETTAYNYYDGFSIKIADLDGKNKKTFYRGTNPDEMSVDLLAVSNSFVYMAAYYKTMYWQLSKDPVGHTEDTLKSHPITKSFPFLSITHTAGSLGLASNYKIEDEIRGIKNCNALKSLISNHSVTNDSESEAFTDESLLCVHGTKVSGESRCKCTQGYTGERCDVSVCQNYCIQGNCSVSAEGKHQCRCNAGHTGERCEIHACHEYCLNSGVCSLNNNSEPVCQCTGHYTGGRCDVSICPNYYCIQGDCSVSAEGLPQCRCNLGYSGERCQINACHNYCLNSGVCSLNNNGEPVCQCTEHKGARCDIPVVCVKSYQTVSMLKDILHTDVKSVALRKGVKSTCTSTVA